MNNQEKPIPQKTEKLPKIEKLPPAYVMLTKIMARNAKEINSELEKTHGLPNLVDESLHINPQAFSREHGGIYEADDITNDEETVTALDRLNSAADIPNTQKFYKDTYGIDTVEEIIEIHRKKKEISKSNQAEMAITALLHKVLKDRFLVVRTSLLDDYKNGIDNLILDKETGAVICAFDEVLENDGDKNRGASKKIEKIKKSAVLGGTRAKYGVALNNQKIVRAQARNIPVFYLPLESDDLFALTEDLYNVQGDTTTEIENKIFAHLINSISDQKQILEALTLPPVMRKKLEEFESSLNTLKTYTQVK